MLAIQVTIAKNLGEQPRPNSFARVDWYYCRTTIGMTKKVVATFNAEYFKTSFFQGRQYFPAGQAGNGCHAAIEIRWTPTNSSGSGASP